MLKDIGINLRERRQQLGLSQQELSRQTGLTQPTISDIENGLNFEMSTLVILLKVLKGSVNFEWKEHQ